MASIQVKGLEEYANRIKKLGREASEITTKAVFAGAAVVADEIRRGLQSLPIQEGENGLPPVGTSENKLTGVSRRQKADLLDGFGLAPIENRNGYVQTKAGFDGYGSIPTKNYPKGVPNILLIRSIESGTSFRQKNPIIRKAVNKSHKRSVQEMGKVIDNEVKQTLR